MVINYSRLWNVYRCLFWRVDHSILAFTLGHRYESCKTSAGKKGLTCLLWGRWEAERNGRDVSMTWSSSSGLSVLIQLPRYSNISGAFVICTWMLECCFVIHPPQPHPLTSNYSSHSEWFAHCVVFIRLLACPFMWLKPLSHKGWPEFIAFKDVCV